MGSSTLPCLDLLHTRTTEMQAEMSRTHSHLTRSANVLHVSPLARPVAFLPVSSDGAQSRDPAHGSQSLASHGVQFRLPESWGAAHSRTSSTHPLPASRFPQRNFSRPSHDGLSHDSQHVEEDESLHSGSKREKGKGKAVTRSVLKAAAAAAVAVSVSLTSPSAALALDGPSVTLMDPQNSQVITELVSSVQSPDVHPSAGPPAGLGSPLDESDPLALDAQPKLVAVAEALSPAGPADSASDLGTVARTREEASEALVRSIAASKALKAPLQRMCDELLQSDSHPSSPHAVKFNVEGEDSDRVMSVTWADCAADFPADVMVPLDSSFKLKSTTAEDQAGANISSGRSVSAEPAVYIHPSSPTATPSPAILPPSASSSPSGGSSAFAVTPANLTPDTAMTATAVSFTGAAAAALPSSAAAVSAAAETATAAAAAAVTSVEAAATTAVAATAAIPACECLGCRL